MFILIEVIWPLFSSVVKRLPTPVQGSLIVICGSTAMTILRELVAKANEWKPAMGVLFGCLLVLSITLLLLAIPVP
ncbi:MAG: hypothetical protein FJZ93_09450 [Chloroflexi bacterium]|nr:hypothetical protein [Chloroflexota bacterium]